MSNEPFSFDNPLPLENTVVYRMAVATNLNASTWQRRYAKRYDMTLTDWRVLATLVSRPGLSATELSDILAVEKMSITRAVQRLLAAKRVRASTNQNDRRRLTLTVAPRGAAIYNDAAPLAWQHQEALLHDLSTAEQAMLRELLGKVVATGRRLASQRPAP